MASWQRLPTEIKLAIWDLVAREAVADRRALNLQLETSRKPLSLASCAAVSRHWQWFFEHVTFQRLVIDDSEVEQFAALVEGPRKTARLGFIRHLHLHGRFDDYDCSQCIRIASADALVRDDRRFVLALSALMAVLATWDGKDDQDQGHVEQGGQDGRVPQPIGMTLELSAASWSDPYHSIRNFRQCREYPYETADDIDEAYDAYAVYRARERDHPNNTHGWHEGVWRERLPNVAAAVSRVLGSRPLGHAMEFTYPPRVSVVEDPRNEFEELGIAPVKIVRAFMMRRRFYRGIDRGLFDRLISFTSKWLDCVRMEVWETVSIKDVIYHQWNPALRSLSLYVEVTVHLNWKAFNFPSRLDKQDIATSTHAREHVALSYVLDATQLFEGAQMELREAEIPVKSTIPRITGTFWPRLATLALTDAGLTPDQPTEKGLRVIALAAEMVTHMPALQILELWYGDKQHGCLFRFEPAHNSTTTPPTITIQTTWDEQPEWWTPDMEALWATKAIQFSRLPLRVEHSVLPEMVSLSGNQLTPYMRVMEHLALRDRVIDPVSFHDMKQDATHAISEEG